MANDEFPGQAVAVRAGKFPAKLAQFRQKITVEYERYEGAMNEMMKIASARADEAEMMLRAVKDEYRDEKEVQNQFMGTGE